MSILELEVVKGFTRLCGDGFNMGWHERNGGNLTYRMKPGEVANCRPFFRERPGDWTPLGISAANLAGEFFIATGSGKFFRNVEISAEDNICIAELNGEGDAYRIVWGLTARGGNPTSEFPSHLLSYSAKKEAANGDFRAIYHAHTPNIIALSFVLPLSAGEFSRALWRSMMECAFVFPTGVGVIPWMIPGGRDIAQATARLMREFDVVVWAHHGAICAGADFDLAFGLMHALEKSAEIYIKARSCDKIVRRIITDEQLRDVAKAYGAVLNEEMLRL